MLIILNENCWNVVVGLLVGAVAQRLFLLLFVAHAWLLVMALWRNVAARLLWASVML
jgi:hypothetical protein